jgi:hypothetical protein
LYTTYGREKQNENQKQEESQGEPCGAPAADLECFARGAFPLMQTFYESEEGRAFEEWKTKKR